VGEAISNATNGSSLVESFKRAYEPKLQPMPVPQKNGKVKAPRKPRQPRGYRRRQKRYGILNKPDRKRN
jgi:hypothetical protein